MNELHLAIISRLAWERPDRVLRLARFLGIQAELPATIEAHAELLHDVVNAITIALPKTAARGQLEGHTLPAEASLSHGKEKPVAGHQPDSKSGRATGIQQPSPVIPRDGRPHFVGDVAA